MRGSARTEQIYFFNQIVCHTSDSTISIILLVQHWQQQCIIFFFYQIKQCALKAFITFCKLTLAKQHNFMSCHHSRRKRTSSHGILKSLIPGFAFHHLISFQFISPAAHTPFCSVPLFCFSCFSFENN